MPSLDSLPGDQRAVLQLVLSRGRSYDQIARLLSIRPDAVRERALAALTALGPETRVSPENRELIADYLLGQLPEDGQIERARDLLAHSPSERAWARVVSSELAPLAGGALPEIPTDTGARPAPSSPTPSAPEPEPVGVGAAPSPAERRTPEVHSDAATAAEAVRRRSRRRNRRRTRGWGRRRADDAFVAAEDEDEDEEELGGAADRPRSSRLGGLVVIALAIVAVAVALFFVLRGGNGSHPSHTAASATAPAGSTAAAAPSTSTSSSSTTAKVVSQINLRPPNSSSKAVGIAEVLNEGSSNGIAVIAQNVPPNRTKAPVNAYAVWLYNSPTDATNLGFVNPGVGSNGRLSTAGPLPSNASHYKRLIVTVETTGKPKTPGRIILEGTLRGL